MSNATDAGVPMVRVTIDEQAVRSMPDGKTPRLLCNGGVPIMVNRSGTGDSRTADVFVHPDDAWMFVGGHIPDDDGNPGCDNCGSYDADVSFDGEMLCKACFEELSRKNREEVIDWPGSSTRI